MVRCLALIFLIVLAAPLHADQAASLEVFEKHVRPMLLDQCIRCHGPKKQQAGLRLDSREALLKGGDSGPVLKPGDPDQSLLLKAIRYEDVNLEMPPRGKLPDKTVAGIEKWIRLGAYDPRTDALSSHQEATPSIEEGRKFWSFQPISNPPVPAGGDSQWAYTDIDRFVFARLLSADLTPVPDANRETLIRRVHYDLIGLPPTPARIEQFVTNRSANAFEKLVDELLNSPHFGERWGRHWLDVVRFAESSGGGRTLLFPNAWRYRDYVIDAFNNDVPYDRFLREQIAGDLLECDDWQQKRRNLIATAFLLLGPTNYELQDKDVLEMDIVDEQLDTLGKALLGMTIGCARCHDHKFDPIPTTDYYALAGILKSTKAVIHSNVSTWNKVDLPLPPDQQAALEKHQTKIEDAKRRLAVATTAWKQAGGKQKSGKYKGPASIAIDSLPGIVVDDQDAQVEGDWMPSTSVPGYVADHYIHDKTEAKGQKQVVFAPKLPSNGQYEVRLSYTAAGNRSTRVPVTVHHAEGEQLIVINQRETAPIDGSFASLGIFALDAGKEPKVVISNENTGDGVVIADSVVFLPHDPTAAKAVAKLPAKENNSNEERLAELKKAVDEIKAELVALEKSAPSQPIAMACIDEEVPADIHLAIRGMVHNQGPLVRRGVLQVASTGTFPNLKQSGRVELANWIASPVHPLTARVMANRAWYWLMGRGLVSTLDNFGDTGSRPSHPQLLDHLAYRFVDDGWSVKKLVKRIVMSRVYRLSTMASAAGQSLDPDNRLWWRMNRKRLRAEDIRDTLLFVGGSLDLTRGGPTIAPGTKSEYGYRFTSRRRSVYLPVFRNALPELFEVFDFADPNIQQGLRTESTIASQALLMMNHPFVIQQAEAAAAGMPREVQFDTIAGVRHAYYSVLGRAPTDGERRIAVNFVDNPNKTPNRKTRWALLYQTLFQCVDFRYLN